MTICAASVPRGAMVCSTVTHAMNAATNRAVAIATARTERARLIQLTDLDPGVADHRAITVSIDRNRGG
ncbi:hypothetical protein GCM10023353_32290 [Tomitella cavernea]|uniref:Uncharacterized protein n=1 Tax=Tomitella cavernea TaxID=1387982 RepID=A0ABP9CZD2_9ACTN